MRREEISLRKATGIRLGPGAFGHEGAPAIHSSPGPRALNRTAGVRSGSPNQKQAREDAEVREVDHPVAVEIDASLVAPAEEEDPEESDVREIEDAISIDVAGDAGIGKARAGSTAGRTRAKDRASAKARRRRFNMIVSSASWTDTST